MSFQSVIKHQEEEIQWLQRDLEVKSRLLGASEAFVHSEEFKAFERLHPEYEVEEHSIQVNEFRVFARVEEEQGIPGI